tara:strand:- start:3371 stop:3886 length:516 start_codon:yes stop_codon:yes gene_type:complete
MRILIALFISSLILSCSTQRLIERGDKLQDKIIKRGGVITRITDTLLINDTITEIFTRNDTNFVNNTIIRYVTEQGEIRYITKSDKRKEHRLEKRIHSDSVVIAILQKKNERLEIRQSGKTNRVAVRGNNKVEKVALRRNGSKWWLFIIIGYLLNFVVRFLIDRYLPKPKK